MKTRYSALVAVSDDTNQVEAIYVPSLSYKFLFSQNPAELDRFKQLGPQYYLENKIREVAEKKQAAREPIKDESKMTLMSQGYSEMQPRTTSYDVYVVREVKDMRPRDIDGVAIVVAGEGSERKTYIITNNCFYLGDSKEKWEGTLKLNPAQEKALEKTPFNPNEPAEITIHNCATICDLKKEVTTSAGWIYLGRNSYPFDVYIYDRTRRPCTLFARILPPFTRLTAGVNLGLDLVINLGLLSTMPNPLFPPETVTITNTTTGNSTDILVPNPKAKIFNFTQMSVMTLMASIFLFAGPRQRSMRGLGLQIDDFFIGLYNKIFGPKIPASKKNNRNAWRWADVKIFLAKLFFNLLVLDQVALMAMMSYLKLNAISNEISSSNDSFLSPEVIKNLTFAQWILTQMSDPMLILSECAMLAYVIESYFRPNNMLKAIKEQTSEAKAADVKSADGAKAAAKEVKAADMTVETKRSGSPVVASPTSALRRYTVLGDNSPKSGNNDCRIPIPPSVERSVNGSLLRARSPVNTGC